MLKTTVNLCIVIIMMILKSVLAIEKLLAMAPWDDCDDWHLWLQFDEHLRTATEHFLAYVERIEGGTSELPQPKLPLRDLHRLAEHLREKIGAKTDLPVRQPGRRVVSINILCPRTYPHANHVSTLTDSRITSQHTDRLANHVSTLTDSRITSAHWPTFWPWLACSVLISHAYVVRIVTTVFLNKSPERCVSLAYSQFRWCTKRSNVVFALVRR